MYTIAVDAMGGDHAPDEIVKGALLALAGDAEMKIALFGRSEKINAVLQTQKYDASRVEIIHCEDVIDNDEQPTLAVRRKKDASMVVGLHYVKDGKAAAFVSAGSTGALLAGATVIVGRIPGVERPALAALLPNAKGYSLLMDVGANVDAKPNYLLQFAKMGAVYMEHVVGVKSPSVGLVNIGAEKEKGNALTKETFELLEAEKDIRFIGNVEAREIAEGGTDVLVCDGFVGNVILKYTEGFAKTLLGMVKKSLMSSVLSKVGALLCSSAFAKLKKSLDYSEVGGSPLFGLKALVVKAHGSSDARAISGAINQCKAFIKNDIEKELSLWFSKKSET